MSYEGPTKSLIDDLGPLLGFRSIQGRTVSADQRVRELRISRGHNPAGRGVLVSLWPLSMSEGPAGGPAPAGGGEAGR